MRRLLVVPALLFAVALLFPASPSNAGKLSEDGRVGVVLEVQGTALVRPAGRERWTPLAPKSVLFPGDLVRTGARGAHALELEMTRGTALVGPGSLIEMASKGGLRLLRGELEAHGSAAAPLALTGPGDYAETVMGTAWLRTADRKTEVLKEAPKWIRGYRASASDEWMGSLLAKVDGRDVPLAVGYHKVNVEVRDQIARTTVEQSFINSTNGRMEGVFYFPLPADASISGFGMWIGGELVEADIVERARARQIYEDILRRKKDPGLLEWEGGNIFKARVFPIEPHSEKRIRIRYTQVLPLEGGTWRYRYALRSELLRTKPLRELQITVRAISTQTMETVASPTHEVLVHNTGHEATAEFSASEYRPDRDFELAVKVGAAGEVTAIPHRRGEDGYLMLLLAPPGATKGAWRRDLAPEGDPLDVVFLADTSGSMDEAARANQANFLSAFLSLLSERDRFRLAACDVEPVWLVADPTAPDDEAVESALDTLAARRSLGWTDLDAALDAALRGADDGTLVVYVGDGVGTTGDADPIALAERLRARGRNTKAVVHAVASSSSYEAPVLGALAEIGGGSVRTVGARPARSAFGLLAEAARPAVKDLRVQVEGLRTARVYPSQLPNLPLGAQQAVLGRFLPADTAQTGTVIVTGTLAGKPVRYTAQISVPAADAGNSFLPRLWGRKHIDALMAEGRSKEVQEEVVAFSERFGIMTPYTSFLVLESDEDRERYGVTRRVRMRDGERFFAEAHDKAALEKKRDLMKQAGRWRVGMRRQALLEIARLGRDLPIATPPVPTDARWETATGVAGYGDATISGTFANAEHAVDRGLSLGSRLEALGKSTSWRGGWGGRGGGRARGDTTYVTAGDGGDLYADMDMSPSAPVGTPAPAAAMPPAPSRRAPTSPSAGAPVAESRVRRSKQPAGEPSPEPEMALDDALEEMEKQDEGKSRGRRRSNARPVDSRRGYVAAGESLKRLSYGGRRWQPAPFTLQSLGFPYVPRPRVPRDAEAELPWNEAVLSVLRGLPRRAAVASVEGGLHFVIDSHQLHATRGTETSGTHVEAWLSPASWRARGRDEAFGEPREAWVANGLRGALAAARRLARTREATAEDATAWRLPVWDLRVEDALDVWRRQGLTKGRIESADAERAVVVLSAPAPSGSSLRLVIDLRKRVILEAQRFQADGRLASTVKRSEFIEAGGRWWAGRIEHYDRKQRLHARTRVRVEPLAPAALERVHTASAAALDDALVVHGKLPERSAAKQALHEKRGRFLDHLVLAVDFGAQSRWKECLASWSAAEALVPTKPGRRWVRGEILARNRGGEAFKTYLGDLVPHAEAAVGPARRYLSAWVLMGASGVLGATERGALMDRLKSAWIDAEAPGSAPRREAWMHERAGAHAGAKQPEKARALWRAAAEAFPFSTRSQLTHESVLWGTGRRVPARLLLERLLEEREPWLESERRSIFLRLTDRLWTARHLERLRATLTRWLKTKPETSDAYQRSLSSAYYLGDTAGGDETLLRWLGTVPADDAGEDAWAAQQAAVSVGLGQGWNFHVNRLEPAFSEPLAALCLALMRLDSPRNTAAARIFTDWRFRRTDAYATLRKTLYADLAAEGAIATMSLARLGRLVNHLDWGSNAVDASVWQAVLDALMARWTAAQEPGEITAVGDHVARLIDAQAKRERGIAFAQQRLDRAAVTKDAPARAADLFRRLLGTPNRDEHATPSREDRAFLLLPRLLDPEQSKRAQEALAAQTARRLAQRLYEWRFEAGIGTPEERAKLSRAAIRTLRREVRGRVRTSLAARLDAAQQASDTVYRPWLEIERLGYAVESGEQLEATALRARAILAGDWKREDQPLERLMRERAAVILAYAATRKDAPDALPGAVLETFEAGDAALRAVRKEDPEAIELLDWRRQIFRLLVARDDVPGLTIHLDAWIVPAKVESRWRIARGYLFAETGALDPAVAQFEAVRALDELAAGDYAVLADWYLVLDQDAKREVTLDARYEHMNEHEISNGLRAHERRLGRGRGGVPDDVDPEAFRALRALMRKASHPSNYWYRLRNMYQRSKDFRALGAIAEALSGHTKEGTYGFLQQLGQLAGQVHEEATCDELVRRFDGVRERATRPLDRRALQLATARVEARASQVPETDPAHGRRALAALQAAFQHEWQSGERKWMAQYLRSLGRIADAGSAKEQLRQLDLLRVAEAEGSMIRLEIALAEAQTLWTYAQKDRALAVLEAALRATRKAQGGRVPMSGRIAFDTRVMWLAGLGRFATAERILLDEMERWDLPMRRRGLRGRLFQLYVDALRRGGSVSLGRGTALFEAAGSLMEKDMVADPAEARQSLGHFLELHRAAQERSAPRDAGLRLETYARKRMPALLARVPLNASGYARQVAQMVRRLQGPQVGLALLLDRRDAEPRWLDRIEYDIWHQAVYDFARWRHEAGRIGALEPRLLALVVGQLERNLLRAGGHGYHFWNHNNKWFWAEHADDFADTAARIAELNGDSPAVLLRAAQFLWSSLNRHRSAIAILQPAEGRGILGEQARWVLTSWLITDRRFEEALPLCEQLVEDRADKLDYRLGLTKTLAGLKRTKDAAAALDATEARFREKKLWREHVAARLGETATELGAWERAERWMEEAIRLRRERRGYQGGRESTLSRYYRALAKARGALGKTAEAVNAAATAILSANPRNQKETRRALESMDQALRSAPALAGFVESYDAEVAKTGLDAPIVRKALARVFREREDHAAVVVQLLIARELDAGDAAVHRELVAAYDALGKAREALDALFGSIRLAPHNLEAYTALAERYRKAGDTAAAERALTNLVEPAPNQADGHRRLATIRHEQKRWPEAILQWRQVVRTEPLDPTGALSLARALIRGGNPAEARSVLDGVMKGTWENRFGDPAAQAAEILRGLKR